MVVCEKNVWPWSRLDGPAIVLVPPIADAAAFRYRAPAPPPACVTLKAGYRGRDVLSQAPLHTGGGASGRGISLAAPGERAPSASSR